MPERASSRKRPRSTSQRPSLRLLTSLGGMGAIVLITTILSSRQWYRSSASSASQSTPTFVRSIGIPAQQPGALNSPMGIATTGTGENTRAYVVDAGNARIHVFKIDPNPVVGTWGKRGNAPGDFWKPSDIALNPTGTYLYVVDAGRQVVMRFDTATLCVNQPTCQNKSFEWGGPGDGAGKFKEPTGIAIDAEGLVYVADRAASNIQVFNPEGVHIRTISGPGSLPGEILQPTDVSIGPDGTVWVADTMNDRISLFKPQGEYLKFIERVGNQSFFQPTGIAHAPDGGFAIRDFDESFSKPRLRRFTKEQRLTDTKDLAGIDVGSPKHFQGVAYLSNGSLLYASALDDTYNLYYWEIGRPNPEPFAMKGKEFTQFEKPFAIAVDEQFIAVTDTGNKRVTILNRKNNFQPTMVLGKPRIDFLAPSAIASYRKDKGSAYNNAVIYVADPEQHSIVIASPSGTVLGKWGNGASGTSPEGLNGPEGVTVDQRNGDVYIADTRNNRIVRRDSTGNVIALLGQEVLEYPHSVAMGENGIVYVVERGKNRLVGLNPDGTLHGTWGEDGHGYSSPPFPVGILWSPVSVTTEGSTVYVLENDRWNHTRVQVLHPERGKPLTAEGSIVGVFANTRGGGNGQVDFPEGITAAGNQIFIADTGNNRVHLFEWKQPKPGIAPPTPADPPTLPKDPTVDVPATWSATYFPTAQPTRKTNVLEPAYKETATSTGLQLRWEGKSPLKNNRSFPVDNWSATFKKSKVLPEGHYLIKGFADDSVSIIIDGRPILLTVNGKQKINSGYGSFSASHTVKKEGVVEIGAQYKELTGGARLDLQIEKNTLIPAPKEAATPTTPITTTSPTNKPVPTAAWKMSYFGSKTQGNTTFAGTPTAVVTIPSVWIDWLKAFPVELASYSTRKDNFSALFERTMTFEANTTYVFSGFADDTLYVELNGTALIGESKSKPQGYGSFSKEKRFTTKTTGTLRVYYTQLGGSARTELSIVPK